MGLANASPHGISLEYEDDLCAVEFHRLNAPVEQRVPSEYLHAICAGTRCESNFSSRLLERFHPAPIGIHFSRQTSNLSQSGKRVVYSDLADDIVKYPTSASGDLVANEVQSVP